jgi:hypothetical protein
MAGGGRGAGYSSSPAGTAGAGSTSFGGAAQAGAVIIRYEIAPSV